MIFKVGDKVRILPSAVDISVHLDAVGKTGVITKCDTYGNCIIVCMDKPRKENERPDIWGVNSSQIEPVIKVGQQLLLWDGIFE